MKKKLYHKVLKLSARHWWTIVKDDDIYYSCDSIKD